MTQAQQPLNPWLTSYIAQHHKEQSRYEIDKYLIAAGYDPHEIELAWQSFEQPPLTSTPVSRPSRNTRIIYLAVAAICLTQVIFAVFDMGVSFNSGIYFFFFAVFSLVNGLAPIPHSKGVKWLLIVTGLLALLFSIGSLIYYLFLK